MRTRIKVCGLRSVEAVRAAVAAGVDAVGFNFYPPSPRAIAPAALAELAAALPPFVTPVLLFVDATETEIEAVAATLPGAAVQLHGAVDPVLCRRLRRTRPVILAHPATPDVTERLAPYRGAIDAVLLDAHVPGVPGGTGQVADWAAVIEFRRRSPELPVILAGGLTPANVAAAIRAVRPYAVDVASGVESEPGRKDAGLMRAFVAAVRGADG